MRVTRRRAWVDRVFAKHTMLSLEYERDLCGRYEDSMNAVWEFLELPPYAVPPPLAKQARLAATAQAANYDELKRHFQLTPYASFFSEQRPGSP